MHLDDLNYSAASYYAGRNAEVYEAQRANKLRWAEENRTVAAYVTHLPPRSSLLDVPFGTGRFASFYIAAGLQVTGVDISRDMIAQARSALELTNTHFDLRVAPAEKLPFADQAFDYLICSRFIKWLPTLTHVSAVASEFRRVCRREMLIQVKVKGTLISTAARMVRRLLVQKHRTDATYRGTTSYTSSSLAACFAQEGWIIDRVIDTPKIGHGVKYIVLRKTSP
jgi:ubiquinone/menaquinone biosynthesis C-methylase UbiE